MSVGTVFVATLADDTRLGEILPKVSTDSVASLLNVMASSMLVIATFAVGSMVSAYSSASNTATPRSFKLVIADDISQNALSTFIGAFIFSVVALMAVKNQFFGDAALFILFAIMVVVFGIVILTFVRWVDRVARLGRLGTTIEIVERATQQSIQRWHKAPLLGGLPVRFEPPMGRAVLAASAGYVQHVNVAALQSCAKKADGSILVAALPGSLAAPGRALAYFIPGPYGLGAFDHDAVMDCFAIGNGRTFFDDPQFGFVVLAEIADRALSPGVNDPGTAIEVLGAMERLLVLWSSPPPEESPKDQDRVQVPEPSVQRLFDDAFTPIARDGAAAVEVGVRLQQTLRTLVHVGDARMREAALQHSRLALARAEGVLTLDEDLEALRATAPWHAETA
ncbi:Putative membrane protein [Imhoffiella purpurea]|uniref:Putative membrane protein n=1 Tax=Imhoffiella purpurea TaxID=1249627 RepID=W9V5K5_9GAMM|nr:Putative membrane protein [Imhoffiella purpurea]